MSYKSWQVWQVKGMIERKEPTNYSSRRNVIKQFAATDHHDALQQVEAVLLSDTAPGLYKVVYLTSLERMDTDIWSINVPVA